MARRRFSRRVVRRQRLLLRVTQHQFLADQRIRLLRKVPREFDLQNRFILLRPRKKRALHFIKRSVAARRRRDPRDCSHVRLALELHFRGKRTSGYTSTTFLISANCRRASSSSLRDGCAVLLCGRGGPPNARIFACVVTNTASNSPER